MTNNTISGLNCMGDCMVQLQVTNMPAYANRTGSYAIKVPFSSLSQTMQFIHRSGGKVSAVTKLAASDTLAALPAVPTPAYTSTTAVSAKSSVSVSPNRNSDPSNNERQHGGKHKK